MFKIGFDAKKISTNLTGIGNYSRAVVNILATHNTENRHLLFSPCQPLFPERDDFPRAANIDFVFPRGAMSSFLLREWWRCSGVKSDIKYHGINLYHGLSNELPFGINSICPSVVTIHDLIFLHYPHSYGRLQRKILEYKTRHACCEASRIIAISEATRRDIIHYYGIDESRIDLVYQGCNDIFRHPVTEEKKNEVQHRYNLPPCYIVAVGTLEWRKNQEVLVRSLALIDEEVNLVFVGRGNGEKERLRLLAESLNVSRRLHILGNVSFGDLPAIYQLAWCGAYMSRIEGFGIPVLEAVVSGIPIVASTGTCLEEAGGPGGIYCDPDNPEAVAEAFRYLLAHPDDADRRIIQGLTYSRQFTEENIARNLMEVYSKILQ